MSLEPIPKEFAPVTPGAKVTDVQHVRDAGARVATVAALRADDTLPERSGGAVRLECHTQAGLGGGHLVWGAYGADDSGMCFRVAGRTDGAWRRSAGVDVTPYLFGGAGDYRPGAETGGTRDNAAIVAAHTYCQASHVTLHIPDGNWLIDSTPIMVTHHNVIRGTSFNRALWFTKIDAPIRIQSATSVSYPEGYHVYSAELSGFSIITYEAGLAHAVLLSGSTRLKLDMGFDGGFEWCVDSPMTTTPLPTFSPYGHNYFAEITIRGLQYAGNETFPYPAHPANGFRNEIRNEDGGLTGGFVRIRAHGYTGTGIYVDRGISMTLDSVTEGATQASIHVKNALDVHIEGGYSEGCVASVIAEDCRIIEIKKQNSAPINLTRCKGVLLGGQASSINLVDCKGVVSTGGHYHNDGTYATAIKSNNVGLVTLSANVESGLLDVITTGYSQADAQNLMVNGDMVRWTASVPWGWNPDPSTSAITTQCGAGCMDTTAPAGAVYSAHLVGYGVYYLRLTPPIGAQYSNTYVAIQLKVKIPHPETPASLQLAVRLGSYGTYNNNAAVVTNSGSMSYWQPLTGGDAGWYLVSAMLPINATWCADGLGLQLDTGGATDVYIADFDVRFGVANQRCPSRATRSFDGSVTLTESGKLRWSATATAEVDPWAGQALINGDRIELIEPAAGGALGWVRVGGAWKTYGTVTA
jgi:hypothetical protein